MLLLRDTLHLLFHTVGDVLKLLLTILESALLFLIFYLKGMLLAENLILALKQDLLLLSLSFLAGFIHNAAGKVVSFTDAFAGDIALYENAYEAAKHEGYDGKDVEYDIFHDCTFDMLTGRAPIVPELLWTHENRPRHEAAGPF